MSSDAGVLIRWWVIAGVANLRPFMYHADYKFMHQFGDEMPFENRFAAMVGTCKKVSSGCDVGVDFTSTSLTCAT